MNDTHVKTQQSSKT